MDIISEKLNVFNGLDCDGSFFASIINCIPCPVQVYTPDGISVMVNRALLKDFGIGSCDKIIGKYNVFNDAMVTGGDLIPFIKRTFNGETFYKTDIKFPMQEIPKRFGVEALDIESMFLDIIMFPVFDKDGNIPYGAAMFINRRVYRGKKEIENAKEYIEIHCVEDFDIDEVAKAVYLSRTHLTRLFKKHTGITPHDYYMSSKVKKLQEKLLDLNFSITQAFAACGLDYSGHFARVFKNKTGLSPSQYRKTILKS